MGIVSVDERYKEYLTALRPSIDSAVSASNAAYKTQSDTQTSLYNEKIAESSAEYDDLERQNAVQKLINEREVAENMANLGLTDSGLNRTQQTAVQLSAANNSAKIARQKQSMVDSLTREMTSVLADIELNRSNAEASIRKGYETQAMDAAVSAYEADVDAAVKKHEADLKAAQEAAEKAAKLQQEQEEKENFLYTLRRTGDYDTNVFVGSDGNEIEVQKGINPYTGYNNATGNNDTAKAYKKYGTFSNGYQPKGVYVGGEAYGSVSSAGKFDAVDGRKDVNVWETNGKNGTHYWLWDGKKNKYVEVSYNLKTGEIRELD